METAAPVGLQVGVAREEGPTEEDEEGVGHQTAAVEVAKGAGLVAMEGPQVVLATGMELERAKGQP